MLFEYFPSHPYAPLVATFVWCVAVGLIAYFTVFRLRFFDVLAKSPMVPPMIGIPALMFTFMMAFMGSAAWQHVTQAHASLSDERTAIIRMGAIPLQPEVARQQSRTALGQYLDAVLNEEWATNRNEHAAPAAAAALDRLEADIWAADLLCRSQRNVNAVCSGTLETANYLKAIDDLRTARDRRLSLGAQGTLPLKWIFAISLALMTAFVIAAIHRTSARTAAIAVTVFCTSAWFVLSMVALYIQPYRGPDAVSSAPLKVLRATL